MQRREGSVDFNRNLTMAGGEKTRHYAYAAGQQLGSVDEGGKFDVLSSLAGYSNSTTGTQTYVVMAGDTLQGIAQRVYGDSNLWYVLADANGLQTDADLKPGQHLSLLQVTSSANSADTWKPYNPGEIVGSTTPSPLPPPPPQHCNIVAAIIVVVIAIVVTYLTAGTAAHAMGAWATTTLGSMTVGAIGAAAGSLASQAAGMMLGTQEHFSWRQVAISAVGGAIGGAVASKLTSIKSLQSASAANGLNTGGNAVAGALNYAGSYATSALFEQPTQFSWAGLAASMAGSMAQGGLGGKAVAGQKPGQVTPSWGSVGAGLAGDVVQREVSHAMGDDRVKSWQQIGVDAFGNALATGAIKGIEGLNTAAIRRRAATAEIRLEPATLTLDVADLDMPLAPLTGVTADASRRKFVEQVVANKGPAFDPAAGDTWDAYVQDYAQLGVATTGATTLPRLEVTPHGSYQQPTPEEEAQFAAVNAYLDSVAVDQAGIAHAKAERARQAAADAQYKREFDAWQREDNLTLMKIMAIGPVGGLLGAVASPWVAGGLSVYSGYEGSQSIKDGHPIWGAVQIGAGVLGVVGAVPGMARSAAGIFDRTTAFGSPGMLRGALLKEGATLGSVSVLRAEAGVPNSSSPLSQAAIRGNVLANIDASASARASSNFEIHALNEGVPLLDASTPADRAIVWSNARGGNLVLADDFIEQNSGYLRLESTPGGQYLKSLKLFDRYPYEQANQPWERLSAQYATGASGQVTAFTSGASPVSVFQRIELPILLRNPNVTNIRYMSPLVRRQP